MRLPLIEQTAKPRETSKSRLGKSALYAAIGFVACPLCTDKRTYG
jgi:hypothetical protein